MFIICLYLSTKGTPLYAFDVKNSATPAAMVTNCQMPAFFSSTALGLKPLDKWPDLGFKLIQIPKLILTKRTGECWRGMKPQSELGRG